MRRLFLAALAIGFACGAMVGEPLAGPQPAGLPCGTCQSGLTCAEPAGSFMGLPVCVRACDAGCAKAEVCLEGLCRRPCAVVNDCGIPGIVDQTPSSQSSRRRPQPDRDVTRSLRRGRVENRPIRDTRFSRRS